MFQVLFISVWVIKETAYENIFLTYTVMQRELGVRNKR